MLAPETRRREPQLGAELAEQLLSWDRRRFIAAVRSVLVDRLPPRSPPGMAIRGITQRPTRRRDQARRPERTPSRTPGTPG